VLDVDGRENYEAGKGEEEAERDEREAEAREIRRKRKNQQYNGAGDVGGHGV
jgi:hypothetical protein